MNSKTIRQTLSFALVALLTAFVLVLTGCPKDTGAQSYKVTFETDGGSQITSQSVKEGFTLNKPDDPEKENCKFEGWFEDAEFTTAYDFDKPVTKAFTLYAKWKYTHYVITFESNGGTAIEALKVEAGKTAKKPADPAKTNYSFAGWYSDSELTKEFKFTTKINENLTLYAKWNVATYTISFNTNGGSAVEAIDVVLTESTQVSAPAAPEKANFTFGGWYKESSFTTAFDFATDVPNLTSSITLYAKWNAIQRKITFNTVGGSDVEAITFNQGESVTAPESPTKTGYEFAGWYTEAALTTAFNFATDSKLLTQDATLYAKWNINKYKVTFESNEGSAVEAQTIDYNAKVTKPADPKKDGHTFKGWYKDDEFATAFDFAKDVITAATTLYAKWEANIYTVTFNSNGGTAIQAKTIRYGATITVLDKPTKTGYSFQGWFSDAELNTSFDENTVVTGDTTLYAKWQIESYAVKFMLDNATYKTVNVEYQGTVTEETPTNDTKVFDKWYAKQDYSQAFNFATKITAPVTIYGKWKALNPNECYVTFKDENNTILEQVKVTKGTAVAEPTLPTKTGYSFLGWFDSDDNKWNFTSEVQDTLILKRKWEANSLTFNVTIGRLPTGLDLSVNYTASTKTFTATSLDTTAYKYYWQLNDNNANATILATSNTNTFTIPGTVSPNNYNVLLRVQKLSTGEIYEVNSTVVITQPRS